MSLLPQPKMIIMSVRHLTGGHCKPSLMHTYMVRKKDTKRKKHCCLKSVINSWSLWVILCCHSCSSSCLESWHISWAFLFLCLCQRFLQIWTTSRRDLIFFYWKSSSQMWMSVCCSSQLCCWTLQSSFRLVDAVPL